MKREAGFLGTIGTRGTLGTISPMTLTSLVSLKSLNRAGQERGVIARNEAIQKHDILDCFGQALAMTFTTSLLIYSRTFKL
jgi:hypothetical protein